MIVGVVGFLGSGKGSLGDLLAEKYGYEKMAFADPVKDATAAAFSWPREMLEGDTKESREWREKPDEFWSEKFGFPVTPRWALQKMGTEAGRNVFHDTIWVSSFERRKTADKVAVVDVRFPNEIDKIKELGGFVVRVVRGPEPEWYETAYNENLATKSELVGLMCTGERMQDKFPDIHYSEWAWIGTKYDYVLDNNGSMRDLEANLDYMLTLFGGAGAAPLKKIA
jgi:hypothetical protein